MPKEKNILVNRGIPIRPYLIGETLGSGSAGSPSGRPIAIDFIQPNTTAHFASDWNNLSDFDVKHITKDINIHYLRGRIIPALARVQSNIESLYSDLSSAANLLADQAVASSGLSQGVSRDSIANNKKIIDGLIINNEHKISVFIAASHLYSGSDPLALTTAQRIQIGMKGMGSATGLYPKRAKEILDRYATSYVAAKDAIILRQVINKLVSRSAALSHQLAIVEAAEAAAKAAAERAAAEAAAKAAAERAAAEAAAKASEAQAIKSANTFRIHSVTESVQLSAAAGSIALTQGSTLTLQAVVQAAIKALKSAALVVFDRGTGIGVGLLTYSPSLGNSDLYPPTTMTLLATDLAPDLPENLLEIASAGGMVDVPYRIYGDSTTYSVISTQPDGGVSSKVPVKALTLDSALNAYTFTIEETPPRTLIFPITVPESNTTTIPVIPVNATVYTGVTLTPIQVEAQALPAIDQLDFRDCIYCFPIDSGLPPIYLVFSEALDSGAFTRKQLDKKFKHAVFFGLTDTRKNTETLTKFRDAINAHLVDADTISHGTYQREKGSTVFFNKKTHNVVIVAIGGAFVSGWKLDLGSQQFKNYIENGVLQ